jgi:hypothetical protein
MNDTVDNTWLAQMQSTLEIIRLYSGFMYGNWTINNFYFGTT